MKRWQAVLLGAAIAGVVLLVVIDLLTGLITAAPKRDFGAFADIQPSVRIHLDTAPIDDQLVERIQAEGNVPVPEFLVRAVLPHGLAVWMAPNYERGMVEIRTLLQEKRGGPLAAYVINRVRPYAEIERFAFDAEGFQTPRRGALTLAAWFPMEKNAADDLRQEFAEMRTLESSQMDGDHVLEVRADNRDGGAYLVLASLLYAFDIDLDEREEKISLTSFKFVDEITLTADVVLGNSVGIVCEMEIEPGQRNKMAIVNLKAGLDELLERIGEQIQREHGLTLTGQSEWHGDTLVFTYRLDDVPGLLRMIERGD